MREMLCFNLYPLINWLLALLIDERKRYGCLCTRDMIMPLLRCINTPQDSYIAANLT